jgi:hypothetical protein
MSSEAASASRTVVGEGVMSIACGAPSGPTAARTYGAAGRGEGGAGRAVIGAPFGGHRPGSGRAEGDRPGRRAISPSGSVLYMTTGAPDAVTPFDPTSLPDVTLSAIAAGLHPVRDVEASPALSAIALSVDALFPVLADCGDVEDYGLVTATPCDLRLCWDCAATHTCHDCDHDARQGRGPDD